MKTLFAIVLLFLISGCAEFSAFKSGVASHGAAAADSALEASRWGNCEAATVGAIKRKYGGNPEALRRWQQYCNWPES